MKYCLGTVQFGLNYGIQNNGKPSEEQVMELLKIATSNNITTFDTASAYGNSEEILGRFFAKNKNEEFKVISKLSSDILNGIDNNMYVDELRKHILNSLLKLRINKIYGIMYHDSKVVNYPERVNALIKIKTDNIVKKIGISIYTPDEAINAIKYDIDIIQVPYNLFDNRLERINFFKKAKEKKIEIFARSSLLQGLALINENDLSENMFFAKTYIEKFTNLCKKYSLNKLDAAVNYVSFNQYIDYIVFGTDNMSQLLEYLSIRDHSLPTNFIKEIKEVFNDVPEKLVNPVLWK